MTILWMMHRLGRGKETVHEKWDVNTGILSGDAMLILAYQYFENYEPIVFQKLAKLFSKTALEVCDGQQLDVDFETRSDVTIEEYINMIRLKTSVLVAAALKMGAYGCRTQLKTNANLIYEFGLNLGLAFQLQDDYSRRLWEIQKRLGNKLEEILWRIKRHFLYLKSLEVANEEDRRKLEFYYNQKLADNSIQNSRSYFEFLISK